MSSTHQLTCRQVPTSAPVVIPALYIAPGCSWYCHRPWHADPRGDGQLAAYLSDRVKDAVPPTVARCSASPTPRSQAATPTAMIRCRPWTTTRCALYERGWAASRSPAGAPWMPDIWHPDRVAPSLSRARTVLAPTRRSLRRVGWYVGHNAVLQQCAVAPRPWRILPLTPRRH